MPNIEHDARDRSSVIHVAVAVIVDAVQQVLISRRPSHVHQGGLWEFPGGKVEAGEHVYAALCREIQEELNLEIISAKPFITILHHYADKSVLLDVWHVTQYQGQASGMEGQAITWQPITDLDVDQFPLANRKIIFALQNSLCLLITGKFSDYNDFCTRLERALKLGVRLVQLRVKDQSDAAQFNALVRAAKSMCQEYDAALLLNSAPELADNMHLGLHVTSRDLFQYHSRPISSERLLSVSCHSASDLRHAEKIHADFVLLSPVKPTSSHPGQEAMGWQRFSDLLATTWLPAYALGGLSLADVADARQAGAQGVAAITALWGES